MRYLYAILLLVCGSSLAQEIPSLITEGSSEGTIISGIDSNEPCTQTTTGIFDLGYGTNFAGFVMADNYNVGPFEDVTLNTLIVNILTPQGNNIASADIKVHIDVGGFPGAVLEFFDNLVPTDQTVVFVGANGNDYHEVTFDLSSSGLVLDGGSTGAKFWIAITTTATTGVDNQFWEATADITNEIAMFSADGGATWMPLTVEEVDYEFVMTVEGDCVLSTNDIAGASVNVFPNPTDGYVLLEGIQTDNAEIQIMDATGRTLDRRKTVQNSLNVQDLPVGLYFLSFEVDNVTYSKKIIKR